ncbi:hypothetical protein PoB_003372100 [Plakobranchus ocellatus]|uniref:Uncharacterized protein n=1 Tax=Plakobranchus ocellatus TaxID=259542 RepID=A0AAV4AKV5_9GAST|nr:hypothetical protein PoB_003372100 [Plakobranchus ocellatus]
MPDEGTLTGPTGAEGIYYTSSLYAARRGDVWGMAGWGGPYPKKVRIAVAALFWHAVQWRRLGSGVGGTVGVAGLGCSVDVVRTLRASVQWTQESLPDISDFLGRYYYLDLGLA